MNSMMVKAIVFSAILMIATIAVAVQMHIDLSDPINWITMLGATAIAVLTFGVSAKYMSQMKSDTAGGQLDEDSWDGIGEYKNELPAGWAWSFFGTIVWAAWYLLFSPWSVNGFSEIGQWNQETKVYNAKFEKMHKNATPKVLAAMGDSIFLVQCAPCHGIIGDGIGGKAEDLTRGHTKAFVLNVIKNGQNNLGSFPGGMPAGMASGAAADKAATFVANGAKGTAPAEFGVCAGCHGANGQGVKGVGPKIAGYDVPDVLAGGKKGAIGVMPSFKTRFTPVQVKALDTYINSLKQ